MSAENYFAHADELIKAIAEREPGTESEIFDDFGIIAANVEDPDMGNNPTLDLVYGGPTVTLAVEDKTAVLHYSHNGIVAQYEAARDPDVVAQVREYIEIVGS